MTDMTPERARLLLAHLHTPGTRPALVDYSEMTDAYIAATEALERVTADRDDAYALGMAAGQRALEQLRGPMQLIDSPDLATERAARDEAEAKLARALEALGASLYGLSWAAASFWDADKIGVDDPCPPVTRGLAAARATLATITTSDTGGGLHATEEQGTQPGEVPVSSAPAPDNKGETE